MDAQPTRRGDKDNPAVAIEGELRALEEKLYDAFLRCGYIGNAPDDLLLTRIITALRALRSLLDRYRDSAEGLSPPVLGLFAAALDPIRLLIDVFDGDTSDPPPRGSATA